MHDLSLRPFEVGPTEEATTGALLGPHSSVSSSQIVFPKGAHYALHDLATCGYEVVGIDWTVDPLVAR